mgnify:CR=1 FL=1
MKKQNFFSIPGIAALALLFVACSPEQLEELPAAAILQNGADTSRHQALEPGRSLEAALPLQYHWPNPLPANALVKNLTWSANDYVQLTYNKNGQVAQRYSQWQFVQGDPTKIKKFISDFQYDAQGRLTEITSPDGPVMQYQYQGGWIEKVRKVIPATGAVTEEVNYSIGNRRITQEIRRFTSPTTGATTFLKSVFGYDDRGNLNRVDTYAKTASGNAFVLQETVLYSDFDDKINPTSWMLRTPYLPQVRWQINNPRKKTVILAIAQTKKVTTYSYTYNEQGLPASQTTNGEGGPLTVYYQY